MNNTTDTTRPETKAARDIKMGDWCAFGRLTWQAGEPVTNDRGRILIQWGNGTVSEFDPGERIRMHYDD
jgi:hypothetical protein